MKRTCAAISVLILLVLPIFAQTNPASDDLFGGLHRKGSQIISLSMGAGIPLFILPADALATETTPLGIGASFNLGYQYFIVDRITIGGSLTGAFNGTVGGRTLFMAPVAVSAGYWWATAPMEYMVGLDLGMNILRLSGNGMITPFAKLGGGLFVQIGQSWTVGGKTYWWLIPELHSGTNSDLTRWGNFLEISLGAMYHF